MMFGRMVPALAVLSFGVAPAQADQATPVQSHKLRPPADPNQKICEDITIDVLVSPYLFRLARICSRSAIFFATTVNRQESAPVT